MACVCKSVAHSVVTAITLICCFASSAQGAISITEMQDIDFGTVAPTTAGLQQSVRVCINQTPKGPFQIVGIGSGQGGAFSIASGSGREIDYRVRVGNRGNRYIDPGIPLTGLNAPEPRANGNCQPPYTRITVQLDDVTLQAAPGGIYQGTLQITVAPE